MEEGFLKFSNLSNFPEIIHGISNRSYGQMKFGLDQNEEIIKNRRQFFQELAIEENKVIVPRQVHGSKIAIVSSTDQGKGALDEKTEIPGVDGLLSSDKETFLMIKTADCLPILMYDSASRIIAALHASWRGIIDQIIPETISQMRKLGTEPENLIIGIGPGICQKHFVVRNSVLKLFLENYPAATFVRNNDGYVDLKKAVLSDLKKAKVAPGNIEIAPFCTVCDNGLYGSFRKEGSGALEIAAIIGMKG